MTLPETIAGLERLKHRLGAQLADFSAVGVLPGMEETFNELEAGWSALTDAIEMLEAKGGPTPQSAALAGAKQET